MALIKGICKNFGECDHADNKEVQEVDKMNFVCEECGKPLFPIEGKTSKSGNKAGINVKLIGIVIAALLLLGGLGYGIYVFIGGDPEITAIKLDKTEVTMKVGETIVLTPKVEPEGTKATFIFRPRKGDKMVSVSQDGKIVAQNSGNTQVLVKCAENPKLNAICKISISNADEPVKIDSTTQKKDSVVTQPVDKKEQKVEPKEKESKPQQVTTPPKTQDSYGTVKLSYGKYSGNLKNGQPDGTGMLTFTKSYQLNSEYTAQPGEYVQGVFENGRPVFVTYYQKDGAVTKIKLR